MKISELAAAAGCGTETIRFYEKIDLLPKAQRKQNNYRMYNKKHLERLIFIRNCRMLEMSHDEIRTLIAITENPADQMSFHHVHVLLDSHLQHIDERIAELNTLRLQLMNLQKNCQASHENCAILQGLSEMAIDIEASKSHL